MDSDRKRLSPDSGLSLGQVISRRRVLQVGAALLALPAVGEKALASVEPAAMTGPGLDLAPGLESEVVLAWGDPLFAGLPPFDPKVLTGAEQARRFGAENDFTMVFSLAETEDHILLCVNHESPDTGSHPDAAEQLRVAMASVGVSVVELQRTGNRWRPVLESRFNRRITASTEGIISGPAAGSDRLKTEYATDGRKCRGTFGNCAGGKTPWGTYLTAEENIQGFFGGNYGGTREEANYKRFGMSPKCQHKWDKADARFDMGKTLNEPNHFGWIVEIDPFNPEAPIRKRTALGRMKHEVAATAIAADGRLVVYTGDDQVFEYLYKFVSRERYVEGDRAHNETLLDDGVLHCARFGADGKVDWLPLVFGSGPLTAENGFHSQADVLIETRRAGDLLGATAMDRPEDIDICPRTGQVYVAMTGNSKRQPGKTDAANPHAEGAGHIVVLDTDYTAARCGWQLLLTCGRNLTDPEAKVHASTTPAGRLVYPDNLAFPPGGGRLLICSDGYGFKGFADGVWFCSTEGEARGLTVRIATVPAGSEATGPCFSDDARTLFLSIQHPKGSANAWPDFQPGLPARSAVVAIRQKDGTAIG